MTGEQLSASLATVGRRMSDGLRGLPVKKLQYALGGILVLWILYSLAQLVVVFIPPSDRVSPQAVSVDAGSPDGGSETVDVGQLQALNLFGEAGAVPEPAAGQQPVVDEAELNAAKTQLNLTLEGIIYSPEDTDSAAVIVHQGKQELFQVGDEIPAGNRVILARVLLDRVILDNNGRYESLWLYDDEKTSASAGRSPPRSDSREERVTDMRDNRRVTDMARSYRERLMDNPTSLADVIRIAPFQKGGELQGYRISPGKDREQFEALGLQSNDIVTSINNIELNEPSNALEVYKLMRTAQQAQFTILRNGQNMQILVSLGTAD